MSGYERKLCDRGLCNFNPMVFRNLGAYYEHFLTVNVAMTCVTPMNEHGYFNFSVSNASARAVLDKADVVILEVNENLPWVYGGLERVHPHRRCGYDRGGPARPPAGHQDSPPPVRGRR